MKKVIRLGQAGLGCTSLAVDYAGVNLILQAGRVGADKKGVPSPYLPTDRFAFGPSKGGGKPGVFGKVPELVGIGLRIVQFVGWWGPHEAIGASRVIRSGPVLGAIEQQVRPGQPWPQRRSPGVRSSVVLTSSSIENRKKYKSPGPSYSTPT